MAQISAVISQNSKGSSLHAHSPLHPNDADILNPQMNNFPDTSKLFEKHNTLTVDTGHEHSMSDNDTVTTNKNQLDKPIYGRRHSRQSRTSISHSNASMGNRSIIMKHQNSQNRLEVGSVILGGDTPNGGRGGGGGGGVIIGVGDDDDVHSHVTPSVAETHAGDPLKLLLSILSREPVERTDEEVDYLVAFFENYQIMTEDVDTWSGKATFREFIKQTRYKYIPQSKFIFREGDEGDEFYFVLRGNVSVLVDDASHVSTSKRNVYSTSPKQEIHTVEENHVFGEIAMFNQGKRSATCVAKTDTHLAYWDRATYDDFIRPMKELRHKAQKILRDKQGNMLSEDQLIEKAAMFLDDAMHGRELKMHRNGPWPRRIHKLINHKYFNYCLVMVSMLWLALIFIEPPSYRDSILDTDSKYFYRIMPLIAFEWFVFLIFFGECALRFYSFGRSWFFTIDLHVCRVILLIIFACDLITACIYQGNSPRFSRVIRPIFPVLFIRDLRRQYYIVLACVPYIIELILLWGFVAAIFARIAYHIFYHSQGYSPYEGITDSFYMSEDFATGSGIYSKSMGSYCQEALNNTELTNCSDFFDPYVWNSFSTFFKSIIALFVLLTTENFPEVWWPTWLAEDGKAYWSFFLIYALIAVFFLMNLFSAAVYDAYQHIISRLDVVDEKRETQALKVAWICLDTGDTGAIGYQKFENLMYRLKPEYSEFEIGVIFRLLDPDNNRLIHSDEFSYMMINVLYLSISRKTRSKDDELKLYLQKLGGSCPFGYEILRLFTSQTWRYIMLVIQSLDICALLSYHRNHTICNLIDFICVVIILIALVLDVIFKHMSQLKTYFKSSRNRLYFGLTLIQTIGTFIGIAQDRYWVSALRFFGILRILIVGVFALEKIKYLRTSLTRTLTQTVIFMIPVFMRIVTHVLVVLLYIYIVIGLELFVPDESQKETWGQSRCKASDQLQSNPYALFCNATMALITLFQILTTNNWHIIMYKAIEVTDNWFMAIYFMSFFFLGPILVVSLLLAMFFNMFFGVSMQSEEELSAFLHETDQDAKQLQEHMDLQDFREQMDQEQFGQSVPLPNEVGISELPNGAKILTIKRPKTRNSKIKRDNPNTKEQNTAISPIKEDEEDDDNDNYNDNDSNYENETKSQEMELVHIPLHRVAREIWEDIPGQEWHDANANQTYKQTFTGKEATQYLLDKGFAPDGEEAVDYLALIMVDIGAFMRVDAGKEQEFINDENAHYQWIHIPIEEDYEDEDENDEQAADDHVATDDIIIGFRHSYGGYHRMMKQYRQLGIDPTAEAARANADAARVVDNATPLSEDKKHGHNREKSNSPEDKALAETIAEGVHHIKTQSQKALLKLVKQDSNKRGNAGGDKDKDNNNEVLSPIATEIKSPTAEDLKKHMDDSDDDIDDNGTVIVLQNNNSNTRNASQLTTPTNDSVHVRDGSNGFQLSAQPLALAKIDSNSSEQGKKNGNNNDKTQPWNPIGKLNAKDAFSKNSKLKRGNKGSLELHSLGNKYKKPNNRMRKTVSNGDENQPSTFARRQTLPKQVKLFISTLLFYI